VATGQTVVELGGMCAWDTDLEREDDRACRRFPEEPFPFVEWAMRWSPDGTHIAAVDGIDGYLAVWEAETGTLVHAVGAPEGSGHHDVQFSPDSRLLIASRTDGLIVAWSTETWEIVRETTLPESAGGRDRIGFAGYAEGGRTLVAVGGYAGFEEGWLYRLDPVTLEPMSITDAHDSSPKTMAVSLDGSTVVTGASDGLLRVWDAATGQLRDQVGFDSQVQGARFLDDQHVVVAPATGSLFIITIDPDELIDVVAGSLTRGLTPDECQRFGFGDDCPTVEELQAG
jgi:WD40 repeat protein